MYPTNPYAPHPQPPFPPPPMQTGWSQPPPGYPYPQGPGPGQGGYPMMPPPPQGGLYGGQGYPPPPPGMGEVGFLPFLGPIGKLVSGIFSRPKPPAPVPMMVGPGSAGLPPLPELFYRSRPQFCQMFCPPNAGAPGQGGNAGGRRRRRRGSRLGGYGGWL